MSVPAGWYPDPNGVVRWWDGYRWTEAVQGAQRPPAPAQVPSATSSSTVWIWLVVLLPLLTLVPTIGYLSSLQATMMRMIATMPYAPSPDGMVVQQLDLVFDPWYLTLIGVGFVVTGLVIWFAYLDRRELVARGYARTFHWAWAFLGIVYPIGRSVVVRRQAGRGLAPMWVAIAVQVTALVVVTVWTASFMSAILGAVYDRVGAP